MTNKRSRSSRRSATGEGAHFGSDAPLYWARGLCSPASAKEQKASSGNFGLAGFHERAAEPGGTAGMAHAVP